MGSLLTISSCLSASWPSFTVLDTLTQSWSTHCGRRSWRKASEMSTPHKNVPFPMAYMKLVSVMISLSCLELGDTVAMSPADRMRSLSLKLVSLGRIYAGTPRYFPLGTHSYLPVIMFRFSLVRFFQLAVYYFVNINIIRFPLCIIYVSMSQWYRPAGSCWCPRRLLNYPLITSSLIKLVLSVETKNNYIYSLGTCTHAQGQLCQMLNIFPQVRTNC